MVSEPRSDPDWPDLHHSDEVDDEENSTRSTLEKLEIQLQKQEALNTQFSNQIHSNSERLNSSIQEFQHSLQLIFQELKDLKQARIIKSAKEHRIGNSHLIPGSCNQNSSTGILGSAPLSGNGSVPPLFSNHSTVNRNSQSNVHTSSFLHHKSMKLEFPVYDGSSDVLAWIEQTELVFRYYKLPDSEKVQICSFHLQNEALQWFHWLSINVDNYFAWKVFKEEIITKFSTVDFQRPFEALSSIKQTTSVREYLSRFEQILNLLDKLPHKYLLDRFVGGLKDDIKFELLFAQPKCLRDAITLAKISEEKHMQMRKPCRQYQYTPHNNQTTSMFPPFRSRFFSFGVSWNICFGRGNMNRADKLCDVMFEKHDCGMFGLVLVQNDKTLIAKTIFIFDPGGGACDVASVISRH